MFAAIVGCFLAFVDIFTCRPVSMKTFAAYAIMRTYVVYTDGVLTAFVDFMLAFVYI